MPVRSLKLIHILFVVLLSVVFVATGCDLNGNSSVSDNEDKGNKTESSEGTIPSPNKPDEEPPLKVSVYLLKGEERVPVSRSADSVTGALNELLKGPTSSEKAAGISSAIPDGTRLLGYSFQGGSATADFSREILNYGGGSARIAAILDQIRKTILENEKGAAGVTVTVEGTNAEELMQP